MAWFMRIDGKLVFQSSNTPRGGIRSIVTLHAGNNARAMEKCYSGP
jgi:hypothetical protein